jgi:hypothetical protein
MRLKIGREHISILYEPEKLIHRVVDITPNGIVQVASQRVANW